MLREAILLWAMIDVCTGFQTHCEAIPKQLRAIKEYVNQELEKLANHIELNDCFEEEFHSQSFERDGWELIFRATAGNNYDTYDAWVSGTVVTTKKPRHMKRACGLHYRDPKIDRWTELDILRVKYAFFEHGKEVAYVIFNGQGTNNSNWFSRGRLISSSWCDLQSSMDYNLFSIYGHEEHKRRFFINFNYGGCDNDRGHTVIIDKEAMSRPCLFDDQPNYPQLLYSKISTADHWNRRMFGRADHVGIFIQRSDN